MPMIASGALQDVGFRGCHFEKGRRRHWTTIGDGGGGGEGTDDGDDGNVVAGGWWCWCGAALIAKAM